MCTGKWQEQKPCSNIHCHLMITPKFCGSKQQYFCGYFSKFLVLTGSVRQFFLKVSHVVALRSGCGWSHLEGYLLIVWRVIFAVSSVLNLAVE